MELQILLKADTARLDDGAAALGISQSPIKEMSFAALTDCQGHGTILRGTNCPANIKLEADMKAVIAGMAIAFALATAQSAEAKGCLKGAVVGGAAGHYAGHHGILGAVAGCVIGRHEANKRRLDTDRTGPALRPGEERL